MGMKRSFDLFSAAALVAFLAGCGESSTQPPGGADFDPSPGYALADHSIGATLSLEAEAHLPGAAVELVLENHSSGDVGYNLCFHDIERSSGAGWESTQETRICTLEIRFLRVGETARHATQLPEALEPGEYRYRVAVHLMESGESWDLASEVFQIPG